MKILLLSVFVVLVILLFVVNLRESRKVEQVRQHDARLAEGRRRADLVEADRRNKDAQARHDEILRAIQRCMPPDAKSNVDD